MRTFPRQGQSEGSSSQHVGRPHSRSAPQQQQQSTRSQRQRRPTGCVHRAPMRRRPQRWPRQRGGASATSHSTAPGCEAAAGQWEGRGRALIQPHAHTGNGGHACAHDGGDGHDCANLTCRRCHRRRSKRRLGMQRRRQVRSRVGRAQQRQNAILALARRPYHGACWAMPHVAGGAARLVASVHADANATSSPAAGAAGAEPSLPPSWLSARATPAQPPTGGSRECHPCRVSRS